MSIEGVLSEGFVSCPPPIVEALLYGIMRLQNKIKRTNTIVR
jgi:NADH:ubiquinone oxidoreductase subunit B-like Fe-S oxidoreductase